MNAVMTNIDPRKIQAAIEAAKWLPHGPERENSREADKFVIRAYVEMFEELGRLAGLQLRSRNSEVVMAIIDSIEGRIGSRNALDTLCHYLGEELSTQVLAVVPEFKLSDCSEEDRFVVRYPLEVRDAMFQAAEEEGAESGIAWLVGTLLYWINAQRKKYALYTALSVINSSIEGE